MHLDEFIRHTAKAKNMRCVIYGLNEEQIKIIRKYHRNRGVGVLPTKRLPKGKCFTYIYLPEFLSDLYEHENDIELLILLSSIHLAPIVTSPDKIDEFSSFAVKDIRASNYSISDFLRHLRISEYAMIDYYLSNKKENIDKFAHRDIKRFWRILDGDGSIVGYYLSLRSGILSIVLSFPNQMA